MRLMKFNFNNFKNGELTLLSLTLFLAIFSLSVILFFTESLRATLMDKNGLLMGGDRVITSPTPLDSDFKRKASDLHLNYTYTTTFLSMLVHGDEFALADVKAVDEHYPLKGNLQGSDILFGKKRDFNDTPEAGTVWLETNLFTLLNISINDIIKIGEADFRVTRVLTFEPDRGGQGLSFAPRALINEKDIERTKVIQPGSRQTYKLGVIGTQKNLQDFETYVLPKLSPIQKLKIAGKEQPILDNIFNQTHFYLNIVIMINLLFASIAVSQTIRRYCLRQYNKVAILRCFGVPFKNILTNIAIEISVIGIVFASLGFLLAALAFTFLRDYIESPLSIRTEMVWLTPILAAIMCVLFLLFVFGLPPILGLKNVSPLSILKRDFAFQKPYNFPTTKLSSFSRFNLILNDSIYFLTHLPKMIIEKIFSPFPYLMVAGKYGIGNLYRYFYQNLIQIMAFSIVLAGAFLLFFIHNDLMQSFKTQTPKDAPNFFAINIDPNEVKDFKDALNKFGIPSAVLYPIIRGRLLSINTQPVLMDEMNATEPDKKITNTTGTTQTTKRIPRLLNLSYVNALPYENEITQGQFFTKKNGGDTPPVSIEQGFAERMGIKLNDTLTFLIAEKTLNVKVTSFRRVNWDSFHPNFFVLFPLNVLENFPKTYMTSFYVNDSNRTFLKQLLDRFPSVNLIDITMVLEEANSLITTVSKGIQFILLCSGLMAICMLFASLYAHLDERKKDALLFRILGASKQTLTTVLLTEFLFIGFFSGLIATLLAYLFYLWIAGEILKITYVGAWKWLPLGPVLGMILIGFISWWMLRNIVNIAPKALLTRKRIG